MISFFGMLRRLIALVGGILFVGGKTLACDQPPEIEHYLNVLLHPAVSSQIRAEDLDRKSLDFSLESLRSVDKYLDLVHQKLPDDPENPDHKNFLALGNSNVVAITLQLGIYSGEVIRRNAPKGRFEWCSYDDTIAKDSKLQALFGDEVSPQTAFVLVEPNGGLSFPLGKVLQFLRNGSEDSLHFFAVMIGK